MTKNFKEIYVNITYKSYSIENPMYRIPLSPAGGLLCTVRLIFEIYSVRDRRMSQKDAMEGCHGRRKFVQGKKKEKGVLCPR